MNSLLENPQTLVRLTPDVVQEVAGDEVSLDDLRKTLISRVAGGAEGRAAFLAAVRFEPPYGESWIHREGDSSPYLSLEILAEALPEPERRGALLDVVLSENPAVPFDYRALAAVQLVDLGIEDCAAALQHAADHSPDLPARTFEAKVLATTDGIDHLFDVSQTVEGRLELLRTASSAKTMETRALLASRVLRRAADGQNEKRPPLGDSLVSHAAEAMIAEDVGTALVSPTDYLVRWDQEIAGDSAGESA